MKIIYSPKYEVDIGSHVFPTLKYRKIIERLLEEYPRAKELIVDPKPASDEEILLVHTKEYVDKLKFGKLSIEEIYKLELPYSKELVEASWICAGGTVVACRYALEEGESFHVGGGFHHAFPDHGEGFCVINDIAVGIKVMQKEGLIKKAAVIDCDLHQGNGTAFIFQRIPSVFTFSIHQENNYPIPKMQSSLDIGLRDGVGDEEYLLYLRQHIPEVLDNHKPELVVYLAGADPYEDDTLGGLSLTLEGLKRRDEFVIGEVKKRKIPYIVVLGGGYARLLEDTVKMHYNTLLISLSKGRIVN